MKKYHVKLVSKFYLFLLIEIKTYDFSNLLMLEFLKLRTKSFAQGDISSNILENPTTFGRANKTGIKMEELLLTGHAPIVRFEVFVCVRARIAELLRGCNDAAVLLVVAPERGIRLAFNKMTMVHPYHVYRHGSSPVSFIFRDTGGEEESKLLSARDFFVEIRFDIFLRCYPKIGKRLCYWMFFNRGVKRLIKFPSAKL